MPFEANTAGESTGGQPDGVPAASASPNNIGNNIPSLTNEVQQDPAGRVSQGIENVQQTPPSTPLEATPKVNLQGGVIPQQTFQTIPTSETTQPQEVKELSPLATRFMERARTVTRESWSEANNSTSEYSKKGERARILALNLSISRANMRNAYEVINQGYSPEQLWVDAVQDQLAEEAFKSLLMSADWNPQRYIDTVRTIQGVSDGETLPQNSLDTIINKVQEKTIAYYEFIFDNYKQHRERFGNLGDIASIDRIMFLTEQLYGPQFTNRMKGSFKEILSQDYQVMTRPEDLQFLKIDSPNDLLQAQTEQLPG